MTCLSRITAAILAGGLGSRLRAAVTDKPKVLAEVYGRPFITYLLDKLAESGVRRVVLCTGYMAEQVHTVLGGEYRGIELLYSEEVAPLGTGGALRLALPLLLSSSVLVLNGDSFCDADITLFAAQHITSGARTSIVLATVADVDRYGSVEVADNDAIIRFEEKGNQQGEGLINAGIYLFDRSVIETIPAGENFSLERDLFPFLAGRGLYGFSQSCKFIDIGVPADYYAASVFFAKQSGINVSGEKL